MLQNLLDDASKRDHKIPYRGGLRDLFGLQVIHSDAFLSGDCSPHRSIQIPMIPTGQALPAFDLEAQERVTSEFQAKLLGFRRAKLSAARGLRFDASKFNPALRELACSLATATPGDEELQAEVCDLLKEKDDEVRSEKWTSPSSVSIEAVLVVGRESPEGQVYVSELAPIVQEILHRRGSAAEINPAVLGKILKHLGFNTEPRDAKGKKLNLAVAVRHAEELARDFGVLNAGGGQTDPDDREKEA